MEFPPRVNFRNVNHTSLEIHAFQFCDYIMFFSTSCFVFKQTSFEIPSHKLTCDKNDKEM